MSPDVPKTYRTAAAPFAADRTGSRSFAAVFTLAAALRGGLGDDLPGRAGRAGLADDVRRSTCSCTTSGTLRSAFGSSTRTGSMARPSGWPRSSWRAGSWCSSARRWMKGLGVLAVVAVIVQGVLGGTRVTQVSTLLAAVHGCVGQAFFGLMVALCVLTGRGWQEPTLPRRSTSII